MNGARLSGTCEAGCNAPEVWQARCDLAALYRLMAHFRMTDLIDTHISARVPGQPDRFLINRYGVLFHEMRATDLIEIDGEGRVLRPSGEAARDRVNVAGFVIHSAIHAARPDLHWVIHTHTTASGAVSAQSEGLLPISQHALKFYRRLAYHDYEGIALETQERARLVRDLGPHKAMLLRNHGALAAGETVAEAFYTIYFLERACALQIAALSGGAPLRRPSEAVCEKTARQFESAGERDAMALGWRSALRLLDDQRRDYTS